MSADEYLRPNRKWTCETDCGVPCALGPSPQGACPKESPCQPRQERGVWICARPRLQGGACDSGPGPDGQCGLPPMVCVPRASLRFRRRHAVFLTASVALAACALTLTSGQRNEILVPGGLTAEHAQILREHGTDRCATCHEHARQGFAEWSLATINLWPVGARIQSSGEHRTQSSLCLKCHSKTLDVDTALNPHGLAVDQLEALTRSQGGTPGELRLLACARCHQEHHGSQHSLTRMTVDQCNGCHHQQITAFDRDHPEFSNWPSSRQSRIIFSHAAHASRHFPDRQATFSCAHCHQAAAGQVVRSPTFAQACAECHEESIRRSFGEGEVLLRPPMLDAEHLADYGFPIDRWPDTASSDFDGSFTDFARLLLEADPSAYNAMAKLGTDFDFLDINPEDLDQLESVSDLAWSYKLLVRDLAGRDQDALRRRVAALSSETGPATTPVPEIDRLLAAIPYRAIGEAQRHWFPSLFQELPATQQFDGRQPATQSPERTPEASPSGQFDAALEAVLIPPSGHGAEFSRYWIELVLALEPDWARATTILNRLRAPGAPGDCLACHSIERLDSGALVVNWRGDEPASVAQTLTHFDHGPHLLLPELQDCQRCHQMKANLSTEIYDGDDPHHAEESFEPIHLAQCASCHNARTSTDQCTTCHAYHGSADVRRLDSAVRHAAVPPDPPSHPARSGPETTVAEKTPELARRPIP